VRNTEMSFGLRDHLIDFCLKILKITRGHLVIPVLFGRCCVDQSSHAINHRVTTVAAVAMFLPMQKIADLLRDSRRT
jgi:hypothetical protein